MVYVVVNHQILYDHEEELCGEQSNINNVLIRFDCD